MELIQAMWRATPWAVTGLAVALVLALVAARPLGRRLGAASAGAGLWVLLLGVVLALTATPGLSRFTVHTCALERPRPVPLGDLFTLGERALNVWMFAPLALLSVLPRRPATVRLALGVTLALPFLVEGLQWAVPAMGRTCLSQDVVSNVTGVVLGAGAGGPIRLVLWRSRVRSSETTPAGA